MRGAAQAAKNRYRSSSSPARQAANSRPVVATNCTSRAARDRRSVIAKKNAASARRPSSPSAKRASVDVRQVAASAAWPSVAAASSAGTASGGRWPLPKPASRRRATISAWHSSGPTLVRPVAVNCWRRLHQHRHQDAQPHRPRRPSSAPVSANRTPTRAKLQHSRCVKT